MAADWIKMRSDLYRDPKVSLIAADLLKQQGELARYVSQMNQCDMSVTRNVMRNATVGALVSAWGVMRQRGKRDGDDLVCSGIALCVIDDIADLPGFGAAMASVGWAVETEEGLVFPRFFEEHNVDPAERAKASNADRQRRYRERKQAEESDVTGNVTVTPREEKSREENKAPLTPQGGTTPKARKPKSDKIGLQAFLQTCRDAGEEAIPEDDAVFAYADRIGLPAAFVSLAWGWFKKHWAAKKQAGVAGWRQTFRNAVEGNWPKFWFQAEGGEWMLTTAGKQAKAAEEAE